MTEFFYRQDLRTDALYNFFRFRELSLSISKKTMSATRLTDDLALRLVSEGLATGAQYEDYCRRALETFAHIEAFDRTDPLAIYGRFEALRLACFGAEALEALWQLQAREGTAFVPAIDQSHRLRQLLEGQVTVVLTQPELYGRLKQDLGGREVPILRALPSEPRGAVLFYGEEGLLACQDLAVPSVVTAIPRGFHAQALTGLWGGEGCVVYLPPHLCLHRQVPLRARTRLSFYHLALLEKACGDGIYRLSVEALYRQYPQYFANIYQNAPTGLPGVPQSPRDLEDFDRQLDALPHRVFAGDDNVRYVSAYFNEALERAPLCFDGSPQPGILVQAARIRRSGGARVLQCPKGVSPRQLLADMGGTGLVSNFLFFLTPKLNALYNDLRADRPREQADAASGHLDYMYTCLDGERTETFPLFGKTCIARDCEGRFHFFQFFMGGGRVTLGGIDYRWERTDVNGSGSIRMYTPLYSAADADADRDAYRKSVGQGRVNVVLLRQQVACIRRGDVLLPSVGVVLSLTEEAAAPLLSQCAPLEDGYFDPSGLTLTTRLDPPEGFTQAQWDKLQWAYGGGMTLIREGEGLCDGENMDRWFAREGWTSPLSRQTQESNLHSLVRHPRTAIGCAANGDLLVLVFSGRTWRSVGADYREMIAITRSLFEDVHTLMNCDGGGSAMLGLVHRGEFMELSFPSTSTYSCAGQVRPINTLFYIPWEKEGQEK